MTRIRITLLIAVTVTIISVIGLRADAPKLNTPSAKPPDDERATFQLHPGFVAELVAAEPVITDPVSLTFDHDGRLYVCEMRGYPNAGFGTGEITSGSIKLLVDRDSDGVYETVTTFADSLRFPMGVVPWRRGVFVAVAPDILYLEDTTGDGRADRREVVYTGFGIDNIQQLLNSLQWGMDNWIYGCNGASGGTIRRPQKPDSPAVTLGNRGIRFRPDAPGSLEPMSGGGQYGLSASANQEWFVNTNSEHLKQVILPDHYLRRNPAQAAPTPWANIPEHGAACQVFRISPFESWRVERTGRRASGTDANRFPQTELIPGGFVTSSCSPTVYEADRFPPAYRRSVFICEPANNLIYRDGLVEDGPIFRSRRVDPEQEFLASTDNWFRPVHLTIGPDGALYVADFYRPVIETPRSLPDDMKPHLPLESQRRGRIWRIRPDDAVECRKPAMSSTASVDLVAFLNDANIWWRLNAQRLLVERQDQAAIPALRKLARNAQSEFGRAHALWTLHGMNALEDEAISAAFSAESVLVRCQALRVAEDRINRSASVRGAAAKLADDPSARVRLQAAFSLGESDSPEAVEALARILRRDGADPWIRAAGLSSASRSAPALLRLLLRQPSPATGKIVPRLAAQVGAASNDGDLARFLADLANQPAADRTAILQAIGEGLQDTPRSLPRIWQSPPDILKPVLPTLLATFSEAGREAGDETTPLAKRIASIQLLAFGPFDLARQTIPPLMVPQQPVEIQLSAVRTLARHQENGVPAPLIDAWPNAAPAVRREIQEALFARPERLPSLLDAIESRTILPQQLDAARVNQLRTLKDANLQARAERLLADSVDRNRLKAIDEYRPALELRGDARKGQAIFRNICSTCHRLDDVGTEVGPDLRSALRDKTAEQLLISILDPSREVDRRYTNYLVETTAGRSLSGMIAAESATSLLLRRAEKSEDSILRTQIETLSDTGKSLMPDGLEQHFDKQGLADLLAYLRQTR